MRGKHGVAATARREWSEIERERDEAKLRAERAEKLLTDHEEQSRKSREAVDRQLDMLRQAAESAVAPIVAEMRERLERLRVERDSAVDDLEAWVDMQRRYGQALARTISENFGIPRPDAAGMITEVWSRVAGAKEGAVLSRLHRKRNPSAGARAQAAGRLTPEQRDALAVARGDVANDGRPRYAASGDGVWTHALDAPDADEVTPP